MPFGVSSGNRCFGDPFLDRIEGALLGRAPDILNDFPFLAGFAISDPFSRGLDNGLLHDVHQVCPSRDIDLEIR